MYGTDETVLPRHGLHCYRMAFTHPLTGEALSLSAPLPEDMAALVATIPEGEQQVQRLLADTPASI